MGIIRQLENRQIFRNRFRDVVLVSSIALYLVSWLMPGDGDPARPGRLIFSHIFELSCYTTFAFLTSIVAIIQDHDYNSFIGFVWVTYYLLLITSNIPMLLAIMFYCINSSFLKKRKTLSISLFLSTVLAWSAVILASDSALVFTLGYYMWAMSITLVALTSSVLGLDRRQPGISEISGQGYNET